VRDTATNISNPDADSQRRYFADVGQVPAVPVRFKSRGSVARHRRCSEPFQILNLGATPMGLGKDINTSSRRKARARALTLKWSVGN